MEPLALVLVAAVVIIAVTAVAPKVRVAAPLVLVVTGMAFSLLPFVPDSVEIPPEWILGGVLPPLLYASAVALPTMDFRRDFGTISGLSVLLVIVTSVLLGVIVWAMIPGLNLAAGIAVGAVMSPTDAVATKIVNRVGAPARLVTVLEGEGLLNDATALVVLRSAVAAVAATLSIAHVLASFVWAVLGAVLVGGVVGWLGLHARRSLTSSALTTAVSFVVPFAAYLPAEHLNASGLVAVVIAGLITGRRSAVYLTPRDRMFERTNWETVEILLEGGIFFVMGLELRATISDVAAGQGLLLRAVSLAALTAAMALVIRGVFTVPLLYRLRSSARRRQENLARLNRIYRRLDHRIAHANPEERIHLRTLTGVAVTIQQARWVQKLIGRRIHDTDYLTSRVFGAREGTLLVWAGMRGVVTLAAAQSLPRVFPARSFVVLVAMLAAVGSTLVQGGTLSLVTRRLRLAQSDARDMVADALAVHEKIELAAAALIDDPDLRRPDGAPYEPEVLKRVRVHTVHAEEGFHSHVKQHAAGVPDDAEFPVQHHASYRELWLRALAAQRSALLDARDQGMHDARVLQEALTGIDAEQIMIESKSNAWLVES